jgi:hypothetical protein
MDTRFAIESGVGAPTASGLDAALQRLRTIRANAIKASPFPRQRYEGLAAAFWVQTFPAASDIDWVAWPGCALFGIGA